MLNSVSETSKNFQENIVSGKKLETKQSDIKLFNFNQKNLIGDGIGLEQTKDIPVAKDDAIQTQKQQLSQEKIQKQNVAKVIINDEARDRNTAYSPIEISDMIVDISKKYNMDYKLVAAVIKKETHFKQECKGTNGKGLMQLTSITVKDMFQRPDIYDEKAQALIQKYKNPDALIKALKDDPKVNIEVGVIALKQKLKSAKGNYNKALINYNGSSTKVAYAKKVMNYYKTDFANT